MSERFDVAIVGGGVAGSSLAVVLARAGLGVAVIERTALFRDRVRGEGLHPWGAAEAHRLGLMPVLEVAGAQALPVWQSYEQRQPVQPYHWADDSVDGRPEFGVSHPALQRAMLSAAAAVGATVLRPATAVAYRRGSSPELTISHGDELRTIEARLIVGAGGGTSAARAWTEGRSEHDPTHHRIGGGLFDDIELDPAAAHAASFSGGRIFILPQGSGRARVYVVTAPDRFEAVQRDRSGKEMAALCESYFPEGSFRRARKAGPVAFFPNADTWASRIAGERVVLIGDAAGANDPSVGHGLSLVFRDVRELSERLLDNPDWPRGIAAFADARRAYHDVLRYHAMWLGTLATEEGPEADARRERVKRARESDPTAGGFGLILARGPDGLVADETARRRFFGDVD